MPKRPSKGHEGHPSFPKSGTQVFKFDKSVDSGPLSKEDSPSMQRAMQDERIRRQTQSQAKTPRKKQKFYTVVE